MNRIYGRVVVWNAARYEQEYNHRLAMSLLAEEHQEWYEAASDVEKLDALCDTIFVAMGVMWKANVDATDDIAMAKAALQIEKISSSNLLTPMALVTAILVDFDSDELGVDEAMRATILACCGEMANMGLTHGQQIAALLAVCDSNDSKSVKKTESHIKANGNDKGVTYFAPTAQLARILEAVNA